MPKTLGDALEEAVASPRQRQNSSAVGMQRPKNAPEVCERIMGNGVRGLATLAGAGW